MFFAVVASISGIFINEFIVPATSMQSKELAIYSLQQKHVPEGKTNYTLKETKSGNGVKRLFYAQKCENKLLKNITVVDMSKKDTIQIIQAKEGRTDKLGWAFDNGVIYTLSRGEKTLNTALFETSIINFGLENISKLAKENASQYNFINLAIHIFKNRNNSNFDQKLMMEYKVGLWDKLALPISTIALALVGIPLGITPPRIRYNRGFLFSIIIIFIYFVVRACCISLGETKAIAPFWAAWLPVIVLSIIGYLLYRKKAYKI
jgi:lipopolysaccharide export LptBFGC system permease protein LptF